MNIPRINTDTVKEIIANKVLTNNEKAHAIHNYDYNCSLRATSKPVNRWDLVSVGVIEGELDKSCNNCGFSNNPDDKNNGGCFGCKYTKDNFTQHLGWKPRP